MPGPSIAFAFALALAIMSAASAEAASWIPVSPLLAAEPHTRCLMPGHHDAELGLLQIDAHR